MWASGATKRWRGGENELHFGSAVERIRRWRNWGGAHGLGEKNWDGNGGL
jgi:hypothetical protein